MNNQEMKLVAKIVSNVTGIDLMLMRRLRPVVEAKMCFSKILRERGHTYNSIGNFLGKDHSSIIYYENAFNKLYKTDKRVTKMYDDCMSIFAEELGYYPGETKDVEINSSQEISENKKLRKILRKYSRLGYIIDIIAKYTPPGSEEETEHFLQQVFKERHNGK